MRNRAKARTSINLYKRTEAALYWSRGYAIAVWRKLLLVWSPIARNWLLKNCINKDKFVQFLRLRNTGIHQQLNGYQGRELQISRTVLGGGLQSTASDPIAANNELLAEMRIDHLTEQTVKLKKNYNIWNLSSQRGNPADRLQRNNKAHDLGQFGTQRKRGSLSRNRGNTRNFLSSPDIAELSKNGTCLSDPRSPLDTF